MSSREEPDPTPPPRVTEVLEVSKMKAFWVLNFITVAAIIASMILVFVPFPSLRINRAIEHIPLNLNKHTVPHLIDVKIKDTSELGLSVYLSTKFSHHLIGAVTVGNTIVSVGKQCKHRFLAAYYLSKPISVPRFFSVFDFYEGAIIVKKYAQSDDPPEQYRTYDSSIYLLPHSPMKHSDITETLHDMFYTDIPGVFRTKFDDSDGKVVHDVRVALGTVNLKVFVGDETLTFVNPGQHFSMRLISQPNLPITRITIRHLSGKSMSDETYYIHDNNWDRIYKANSGLSQLLAKHHLTLKSSKVFNIKRISFANRNEIPFNSENEPHPEILYHMAEVTGWNYHIVAADWWYILGQITVGDVHVPLDKYATDRVLLYANDVDSTDPDKPYLHTKHDNVYTIQPMQRDV